METWVKEDHQIGRPAFSIQGSSLLRGPLLGMAAMYGVAVRVRAVLYQRGWLPQRRLPCRVVSIGTHESLVRDCPLYRRLFKLQSVEQWSG
jgi:hypothetical protein